MTPKQIGMVRALLAKADITDKADKETIVELYTNGRTTHLSDMSYAETNALVAYLKSILGQPLDDRLNMVNKILSMAHEIHWELPNGRVDMQRLNNWCVKFSPQKKRLDEFKYQELPALVTQFESVYRSFLKGI